MKKSLLILPLSLFAMHAFSQTIQKAVFDQIVDSRFKPDEPGGTAIIAQNGKIVYEHAFGMASLELNVKMQPDMVFCTGSMTKQFTAICILQLMEQGKLNVTDPISKYIADCPESWQPITIQNLLSHTSGIADQPIQLNTPGTWIKLYQSKPLSFRPGTKYFYANSEYVLLGCIIEKVSGTLYPNYLKTNILTPVGMTHTYIQDDRAIIPNRVPAYLPRGHNYRNMLPSGDPGTAAGTMLSTTHDMLLWNQALITGKLVKKETLDKAWTSFKLNDGTLIHYGYGWQTGGSIQGSPTIEHGGIAVGYVTDAVYLPKEDVYVAVFTNQRKYLADVIANELAAAFIGKPFMVHPIQLNDDSLKTYTGTYADTSGTRTIALTNHKLYYQHGDGPKLPMTPCGTDLFYFDDTQVIGIIKRSPDNHISGLALTDRRYAGDPTAIMKRIDNPTPGN